MRPFRAKEIFVTFVLEKFFVAVGASSVLKRNDSAAFSAEKFLPLFVQKLPDAFFFCFFAVFD